MHKLKPIFGKDCLDCNFMWLSVSSKLECVDSWGKLVFLMVASWLNYSTWYFKLRDSKHRDAQCCMLTYRPYWSQYHFSIWVKMSLCADALQLQVQKCFKVTMILLPTHPRAPHIHQRNVGRNSGFSLIQTIRHLPRFIYLSKLRAICAPPLFLNWIKYSSFISKVN